MRRRYQADFSTIELPALVASMDRPADPKRAYLVRGVDLKWCAKRVHDGEIISQADDRGDAANQAKRRGYHFNY